MKNSGGTTFALLALCSLRPSGQWEGLPPAWPIFQPPSGVELAFRYSDRFHTKSRLGVVLRPLCLIFGSGEDADPPIGTGHAAARVLRRYDPVVCVFDLVPKEAVFVPKEVGFVPKEAVFVPKEVGFVPKEAVFVPKEAVFVPKEAVFVPKEVGFVLKEAGFALKEDGFALKKDDLVLKEAF